MYEQNFMANQTTAVKTSHQQKQVRKNKFNQQSQWDSPSGENEGLTIMCKYICCMLTCFKPKCATLIHLIGENQSAQSRFLIKIKFATQGLNTYIIILSMNVLHIDWLILKYPGPVVMSYCTYREILSNKFTAANNQFRFLTGKSLEWLTDWEVCRLVPLHP